jgi:hypothetical protein
MAVGVLMSRWEVSIDEADQRLRDAAQRAGISDAQVARVILGLFVESPIEEREDDLD